jgi:hypothetical protein
MMVARAMRAALDRFVADVLNGVIVEMTPQLHAVTLVVPRQARLQYR